MIRTKNLYFILVFLLLITCSSFSQGTYNRVLPKYSSAKADTVNVIKNELESPDFLLDKPIDPDKYILGPGDILQIVIISANDNIWNVNISPEGIAVVPGIAAFNLRNKTLREAETLIIEKIKQKYKSDNISLLLKNIRKFKVTVSGEVAKSMSVPVTAVDRVSDAINKAGGLKITSSLRYITLTRDGKDIQVDLLKYYQLGDETQNPTLLGGDFINVMPRIGQEYIKAEGEFFSPGLFEYKKGDSLSTLIRLAQGFPQSARLDTVEFVRFIHSSGRYESRLLDLSEWKLNKTLKPENDFLLESGDRLFARRNTNWHSDKYVTITGEVEYPGHYSINEKTTTLKDLIIKAGGITKDASLENSTLIRRAAYKEQDIAMERLKSMSPSEMSQSERKYVEARSGEIPGRIAVDVKKLLEGSSIENDIFLIDQDSLHIPKISNFVNISGRVNNPGRVEYKKDYTYEDYIKLAGGYGYRADKSSTIIVKSKGQQYEAKKKDYIIEPGDNIVVMTESDTTFFEIFTTTLTILTQILTIAVVVITVINSSKK